MNAILTNPVLSGFFLPFTRWKRRKKRCGEYFFLHFLCIYLRKSVHLRWNVSFIIMFDSSSLWQLLFIFFYEFISNLINCKKLCALFIIQVKVCKIQQKKKFKIFQTTIHLGRVNKCVECWQLLYFSLCFHNVVVFVIIKCVFVIIFYSNGMGSSPNK